MIDTTQKALEEYIECPFCKNTEFDLIGLKHHFISGYCEEYNETEDVE